MSKLNSSRLLSFPGPTQPISDANNVGAHSPIIVPVGARPQTNSSDRHHNPNKSRLNSWIDSTILESVRKYCTSANITLSAFFEKAAARQINNDQSAEICGRAPTPTIDRLRDIDSETDKSIVNLHRKWTQAYNKSLTGNHYQAYPTWTNRDDIVGQRYNNSDFQLIEFGIVYCLSKKPPETGLISRFAYYENEIKIALDSGPELSQIAIKLMHGRAVSKVTDWLNPREDGD